jgi:hypothetical protein
MLLPQGGNLSSSILSEEMKWRRGEWEEGGRRRWEGGGVC